MISDKSGCRSWATRWGVCLAFVVWGALAAGGFAQATDDELPSVEALEKRIAAYEKDETPAAEEARKRLRGAVESLKAAATLEASIREMKARIAAVPQRLEEVKGTLASPAETDMPTVGDGVTLTEREQRQEKVDAELKLAEEELAEITKRIEARIARRGPLVEAVAKAQKALGTAEEALRQSAAVAKTDPLYLERASLVRRRRAEADALVAERELHDAERPLLPLLRDAAQRTVTRKKKLEAFWRARVTERREAEAEIAAKRAEQQRKEVIERFPALAKIATKNRNLAQRHTGENGLGSRIAEARKATERTERLLNETRRRFDATRRKMSVAGLTEAMGRFLRRDFAWLDAKEGPRATDIPEQEADLADRFNGVQLEQFEINEQRSDFGGRDVALQRVLTQVPEGATRQAYEALATELVNSRESQLTTTAERLADLSELLATHKRQLRELAAVTESYRTYIEERILWVPSATPMPNWSQIPGALRWLFANPAWGGAVSGLRGALEKRPARNAFALLAFLALLVLRRRMRRWVVDSAEAVRSYRTDRYGITMKAMLLTALLAVPGPLLVWWIGSVLRDIDVGVVRAVGAALVAATPGYFGLTLFREIARPKHIGEGHFRWPIRSMAFLRRELTWVIPAVVPLSVIVDAYEVHRDATYSESIGRILFALQAIILSVALFRLFRPKSELIADTFRRNPGIVQRTHRWWFALLMLIGALQVGLAATGYYYTAMELRDRLRGTFGLLAGLLLVNALLLRWLFITRRRLAIAQARQRAEARAEAAGAEGAEAEASTVLDEDAVDIPAVDAQTRQLFRFGITLSALVGLFLIWSSSLPALRAFDRVHLWPEMRIVSSQEAEREENAADTAQAPVAKKDATSASSATPSPTGLPLPSTDGGSGESSEESASPPTEAKVITLADVGLAVLILLLTFAAARNIPGLLEMTILRRLALDAGSRNAIATLTSYAIMIIGVSSGFGALGIGWEKVQWLAAALTFGLAFGLQEIFANFVSGIIILIERPVRVGDLVTVGDVEGRVSRLRMRSTTILDWDRRETLIPNKTFITSNVINWSLTDPITRVIIPVGIAYGSDTRKAKERLLDVAAKNELVLEDPKPSVVFRGFGDSTLDFQLRVFLKNRDFWPALVDQMHFEIDDAFRAADVEIAFPQRDLHIRSAEGLAGLERGARPTDEEKREEKRDD